MDRLIHINICRYHDKEKLGGGKFVLTPTPANIHEIHPHMFQIEEEEIDDMPFQIDAVRENTNILEGLKIG